MRNPLPACGLSAMLAIACAALGWSSSGPLSAEEDLSSWSQGETAYARLYSQTDSERAREIALNLELFRAMFERLAPGLRLDSPVPTQIFAFRSAETFAPYRTIPQGEGTRVMGQMVAHRDANYILLDAGAPQDEAFSVVFHEYVHYLVRHNFPGVPRWFNEGLAEYYSTFGVEGEKVVLGRPVGRHLRWLARSELDLSEIFDRPFGAGGRHGAGEVGNFYAGSWALVHYLLSGGAERAESMAEFLAQISEGEDPQRALEDTFEIRLSDLEKAVGEYIVRQDFPVISVDLDELSRGISAPPIYGVREAEIDAALAQMSAHLGRVEIAERHADRALQADGELGAAYGVLAGLRDRQGRVDEAAALYESAVSWRSDSALTYLDYARHLLSGPVQSGPEQGRLEALQRVTLLLDEAARLDPYFAEVDAVRGFSYLFSEGSIDPGVEALKRAIRRMPERLDLVLHHAQLLMKAEEFDRAEHLIESSLAPYADPELLAVAREELTRRRLVAAANAALAEGDLEGGIELLDEAISVTSDPDLQERMEMQLLSLQRDSRVR